MSRAKTSVSRRITWRDTLASIWRTPSGAYALVVLGIWVLVSLVSLVWTPRSLWDTDGYHAWTAPSAEHWLGTDGTGADVFSWLMAGARTNLLIVLLAVALAGVIGVALVAAMTARASVLSSTAVVIVDALISIPTTMIALVLAVPLGASIAVIVIACGVGYGLNLARVARPAALLATRSGYVEAALASGSSGCRVLTGHILPNIMPVALVQLSLSAGTAVLAESGLTYLGIGVPSGVPSWGHSLATSVKLVHVMPFTVIWPGLIVTLVVVALNLLGDGLKDALRPDASVVRVDAPVAQNNTTIARNDREERATSDPSSANSTGAATGEAGHHASKGAQSAPNGGSCAPVPSLKGSSDGCYAE